MLDLLMLLERPTILHMVGVAMHSVSVAYKLAKQVQSGALSEREALEEWDRIRDENLAAEMRWRAAAMNRTEP